MNVDPFEPDPAAKPAPASSRWPWLCLLAALAWVAVVRVPLVWNAPIHLDSDLAVDGLTLLEATRGHFRLHFPGTPYIGTPPVWLALPGAMLFGATPQSLVVGGVIAYGLVVLATFFLAWRAFGPRAACWSLVPLAFASVGTVWLSGRISGGHLLTLAWHSAALAMVPMFSRRGGYFKALGFGLWCGLGYYLDGMFLLTLPFAGLLLLKSILLAPGIAVRKVLLLVLAALGFALGEAPREVGARNDPHDSYGEQFATVFERDAQGRSDPARTRALLIEHLRLLAQECLPRLITGHRLVGPDIPAEPRPASLSGGSPANTERGEGRLLLSMGVAFLSASVFLGVFFAFFATLQRSPGEGVINVPWAMIFPSVFAMVLFVVSKNIYDSDNYRYLVYLLTPWSVGFGWAMDRVWSRGAGGKAAAAGLSIALAVLFTLDTGAWYRGFGWIDARGVPVRPTLDDPALDWLRAHPEHPAFFGDYWDAYRYRFLLGGRPVGLPYPYYPDRYNDAGNHTNRQPRLLVARRAGIGKFYIETALKESGHILFEGRRHVIIDWPRSE